MKHQRNLGLRHPKVRRAYWALFADDVEFNEDHLSFLKDRHVRYLQSLK